MRSISSVFFTTVGIMSTVRATAATKPVRVDGPNIIPNNAAANRPATMEGIPVITSTKNVMALPNHPLLEYSTR